MRQLSEEAALTKAQLNKTTRLLATLQIKTLAAPNSDFRYN